MMCRLQALQDLPPRWVTGCNKTFPRRKGRGSRAARPSPAGQGPGCRLATRTLRGNGGIAVMAPRIAAEMTRGSTWDNLDHSLEIQRPPWLGRGDDG